MWNYFFNQREVLTQVFLIITGGLFTSYGLFIHSLNKQSFISLKKQLALILLITFPLLISNNALSYDVFNYIFNSRMIVKYQTNPHVHTALEFASDDWTRFMHNIHTPAPYGYGWSIISLLPYVLSQGKFILAWLGYRLFSIFSILITSITIFWFRIKLFRTPVKTKDWFILFFNPLFLIEIVSNCHNDLWMMFPAITALLWMNQASSSLPIHNQVILTSKGVLAWIISISTKMASLALAPLMILVRLSSLIFSLRLFQPMRNLLTFGVSHQADLAAILMFLPLFTNRSQQFHPWYLIWSFVWIPLIRIKEIKTILLMFSFTSLLRYYPWMLTNSYSAQVLAQQRLITWSAIPLSLIWFWLEHMMRRDWFKHLFSKQA